jgi:MarR family transcriptional regulator, temperature-dependent positive regulator of motility
VDDDNAARLFDFADMIFAVARQIGSPSEHSPDWCTPIESTVMRFINRNPGTSARTASEATMLPSSNFSRALRGLESKGLVRREPDAHDARSVRLYPTAQAEESLQRLRAAWSHTLDGIVDDPGAIDALNTTLRHIETELIARRRRSGERSQPRS